MMLPAAIFDAGSSGIAVLRLVAALGAGVVAWFVAGPLLRLLARITLHKPMPRELLTLTRTGAAVLIGVFVYLLPIGLGGGAGLGLGSGSGSGSAGAGAAGGSGGTGGDQKTGDQAKEKVTLPQETVTIELLGGERYKEDERFYLLRRQPPAVKLQDLEDFFKKHQGRLVVYILFTPDSVSELHGAVSRLEALAQKYNLPTLRKFERDKTRKGQ
jgi:hypothetical protein